MWRRRVVVLGVAAGVALAGFTAAGAAAMAGAARPVVVRGISHRCTPENAIMQCFRPPGAREANASSAPPAVGGYGEDFAYSCPVNLAKNFGASYVSRTPSKNWTRSCLKKFHAAGKGTVAVYEDGGCDATKGYSLGYSDAKLASQQLAALGAPKDQPFDLAVDCDVAGSRLVQYFRGADAAEGSRVNAFGGYYILLYLYKRHLVGHLNFQTYGWSAGHWLPASIAPLEQYDNHYYMDDDRAIAANYGQWPAPSIGAFR